MPEPAGTQRRRQGLVNGSSGEQAGGTCTHAACRRWLHTQVPPHSPARPQVVDRCVAAAAALGCCLALALGVGRDALPRLFTRDADVLGLLGGLMPFVIASQPVCALAFVWDGVLFGAGGFR